MKDSLKKAKFSEIDCDEIPVPFAVLQGILSSSKSPLCDDFRASRTNCNLGRLGFTCSTAADKLRFCSQILSVYERPIEDFFFFLGGGGGCFTKNARKSADLSKNVHFSSSLGRPMETSWRNTASRYCDNVHGYHK